MEFKSFMEFFTGPKNRLFEALFSYQNGTTYKPDDKIEAYFKDGYMGNTTVFAAMNILTSRAQEADLKLYKRVGEEVEEIVTTSVKKGAPEYYMIKAITKPNSYEKWPDFIEKYFINKYIGGFAPIEKMPIPSGINKGQTIELHLIHPVHFKAKGSNNYYDPIAHYLIDINGEKELDKNNCLVSRFYNPDPWQPEQAFIFGMSKVKAAVWDVAKANEASVSEYNLIKNGGVKNIIQSATDVPINEQQAKNLSDRLKSFIRSNSKGMPWWSPMKLEKIDIGSTTSELATLDTSREAKRAISACFGVPQTMLNDPAAATYSNKETDEESVWTNGLKRNLDSLALELTDFVLTDEQKEAGYFYAYDYSNVAVLQADFKDKIDWMLKAGWTLNEIREATGKEPNDDELMNIPLVANSVKPITEAGFDIDFNQNEET